MADQYFNASDADKLVDEKRKDAVPVEKVMQEMALQKGDIVADLGAGNGYFTIPFAAKTEATVYAVDEDLKMLDLLKERADGGQSAHIRTITAPVAETSIDRQSVDKVLISRVLHHVPSIADTFNEIRRILKPGGLLFVIEFYKIESSDGPPMHIRISADEMEEVLQKVGFTTTVIELNANEYGVKAVCDKSRYE